MSKEQKLLLERARSLRRALNRGHFVNAEWEDLIRSLKAHELFATAASMERRRRHYNGEE